MRTVQGGAIHTPSTATSRIRAQHRRTTTYRPSYRWLVPGPPCGRSNALGADLCAKPTPEAGRACFRSAACGIFKTPQLDARHATLSPTSMRLRSHRRTIPFLVRLAGGARPLRGHWDRPEPRAHAPQLAFELAQREHADGRWKQQSLLRVRARPIRPESGPASGSSARSGLPLRRGDPPPGHQTRRTLLPKTAKL